MIAALHLVLGFLAAATAQPADCPDPQTQHDMNRCAALDFERADAALNALWPDAIAYVRTREESPLEGDGRPSGEVRLREAQRAWILFRDSHCAVEAYEMRGGSAEPLLYNGCRARITEARIGQLRALILDR